MDLAQLRQRRVGVLMSGGLSCMAVGLWLAEVGVDTVCFVADLGQRVPVPPAELAGALRQQGLTTELVDLREPMARLCCDLVRYQAAHEGGYWNTTSGSRATLVTGLADPLRAAACTVLAHGCVGGGNDQARFARYTAAVAPDLTVFTPWTRDWLLDRFPGRQTMTDYLASRSLPTEFTRYTGYSVDGNLGGYAHDGDDLERLSTPARVVRPLLATWPHEARDEVQTVRVRFVAGHPVAIDGEQVTALRAIETANEIGGRNGVPVRSVVENRVNGTKCRGVYEAPGIEVLAQCLAALYQITLDRPATELLHLLSRQLGRAVYEGRLLDTATRALRAAADELAAGATGTVEAELYKGGIAVTALHPDEPAPGVAHQTRFRHGGHHWRTEAEALNPVSR